MKHVPKGSHIQALIHDVMGHAMSLHSWASLAHLDPLAPCDLFHTLNGVLLSVQDHITGPQAPEDTHSNDFGKGSLTLASSADGYV